MKRWADFNRRKEWKKEKEELKKKSIPIGTGRKENKKICDSWRQWMNSMDELKGKTEKEVRITKKDSFVSLLPFWRLR